MHFHHGDKVKPQREIPLELSPLMLSERDRASLLVSKPNIRVDLEIEREIEKGELTEKFIWTVGNFPRAVLAQFSTLVGKYIAKKPSATDISFTSDIKPAALCWLLGWMMEVCTKEKIPLLRMTGDLQNDIDIYIAALNLSIEDAELAAGDALICYIDSCAWDLTGFSALVNKVPMKSRVMDRLLLITLHLCHEDMLDSFDDIRTILKPLPLVRQRMRELDQQIEDPVEEEQEQQGCETFDECFAKMLEPYNHSMDGASCPVAFNW